MKEIQNLSISQLQNEEAFGFFTLVKEEMDNLPADPGEGVAPLKDVKAAYIEKLRMTKRWRLPTSWIRYKLSRRRMRQPTRRGARLTRIRRRWHAIRIR